MPPSPGSQWGDTKEWSRGAALQTSALGCSLERKWARGGRRGTAFSQMNEWSSNLWGGEWTGQQLCDLQISRIWQTGVTFVHEHLIPAFWRVFCSELMEINGGIMAIGYCFYSCFSALFWFSSIGCKSLLETQHVLVYIICRENKC